MSSLLYGSGTATRHENNPAQPGGGLSNNHYASISPAGGSGVSPTVYPNLMSTGSGQLFSMSMGENLTLTADGGSSPLVALMAVPPGQLAELYRKVFETSSPVGMNVPVPLPETTASGENRSAFYRSIEQQQLFSLGLSSSLSDSSLIPWTDQNGLNVWMKGSGSFPQNVTQGNVNDQWQVFVGPRGTNATVIAAENFLSTLIFARMMLHSMGKGNSYEYDWTTRIYLPPEAVLLNGGQLSGLAWDINLGGGSSLSAAVSVEGGVVLVKETTMLTEGNLTASAQDLVGGFSQYKSFEVDYSLPHATSVDPIDLSAMDWEVNAGVDFTISANPQISPLAIKVPSVSGCTDTEIEFCGSGSLSVTVQGSAGFSLTPHLHIDIGGCIIGCPLVFLKSLTASIDVTASAALQAKLKFTGQLTGTVAETLFDTTLFETDFQIGPVPVIVSLDLAVDGKIQAQVSGSVSADFAINLDASYSTGIMYDGHQWSSLGAGPTFDESITGPTIKSVSITASLKASLPVKLELLLYNAVGGYISFEPYASGLIALSAPVGSGVSLGAGQGYWNITLGFAVNVGVTVNDELVQDIDSWCGICAKVINAIGKLQLNVVNDTLFSWAGTFPLVPAVSATASTSSALVSSGSSFQLNGTIVDTSGSTVPGSNVTISELGPFCNPATETFPRFSGGFSNSTVFTTRIVPVFFNPCLVILESLHPVRFQTTTDSNGQYLFQLASPSSSGVYNITVYVTPPGSSVSCLCASVLLTVLPPDNTPPVITPVLTVRNFSNQTFTPNSAGWINGNLGNVTLVWHVNDTETGVASSIGCGGRVWYEDKTVINETAGTTLTCRATDRAGNTASMSVIVRIQRRMPIMIAIKSPLPDPLGWNNGNVNVFFSCFDALSGVAVQPTPLVTVRNEGFNQTATASCTNVAGITRTLTVDQVNIDTSPPDVTPSASPGPNAYGWNNVDVTVTFSCTDQPSGVYSVTPPVVFSNEGAGQVATGTCVDKAFNRAIAVYGTINIDKTPPQTSLTIGSPKFVSGATYVSESTPFSLTATDNLSGVLQTLYGIDDPATPNAYTAPFSISSIGLHTLYYRSVDKAGNMENTRSMTVTVSATRITYTGDLTSQYSDSASVSATLTDLASQTPIQGQTVTFTLGTQTATATTDSNGVASGTIVLNQAPSTVSLTVSFAGQNSLMPASTSKDFTVTREDALVSYTGDMVVASTSSSINLRATVEESSDANGAGFGDLTKASVTFRIYSSGISPILLQTLGPFPVTMTSQQGIGIVVASIPNLSESTYLVIVSLDPGANSFYTALTPDPVVLTVFTPNGSFVTGGGWIIDSSGSHGNFGFVVRYTSSGQVKGHFVYIYRSDGLVYMIKSNAWIGMAIDGNHAFFQGKATVQVVNATTGAAVANFANYQFRVNAWDYSGTTTNGGESVLQITVWNRNGVVFHKAGGNLLGGTIMVHEGS